MIETQQSASRMNKSAIRIIIGVLFGIIIISGGVFGICHLVLKKKKPKKPIPSSLESECEVSTLSSEEQPAPSVILTPKSTEVSSQEIVSSEQSSVASPVIEPTQIEEYSPGIKTPRVIESPHASESRAPPVIESPSASGEESSKSEVSGRHSVVSAKSHGSAAKSFRSCSEVDPALEQGVFRLATTGVTEPGPPAGTPAQQFMTISVPRKQGYTKAKEYADHYNRQYIDTTKERDLRFIVIGDFGGHDGDPTKEYLNAIDQIKKINDETPIHAIINVGDNVYKDGLGKDHTPLNKLFKIPFSNKGLEHVPVFSVLGNHDHCDDPFEQHLYSGNSIDYYLSHLRTTKSPVWIMPDFYYEVEFMFGKKNHKVNFAMIDSMIIRGNEDNYEFCKRFKKKPVSAIQDRITNVYPDIALAQKDWITQQSHSKDESVYQILVDHHPMHSHLKHGGDDEIKKFVEKNLMKDEKIMKDLILSGHEHAFEYGEIMTKKIRQAIVGGTRECDGFGVYSSVRDFVASYWQGRARRRRAQMQGKYKDDYFYYAQDVKDDDHEGWQGCKYGGFAELIFSERYDGELDAEIIFFSGDGEILKKKNIAKDSFKGQEAPQEITAAQRDDYMKISDDLGIDMIEDEDYSAIWLDVHGTATQVDLTQGVVKRQQYDKMMGSVANLLENDSFVVVGGQGGEPGVF